ncbi:MAG TPA: serine hydrolase [Gemmataceae bacterium]|jgi:CubicO group peptidase (beta-lactamase class C family)
MSYPRVTGAAGPIAAAALVLLAAAAPAADAPAPPYPPSPVIRGVTWAPKDTFVRLAPGSDNWPLTWADDDHQYTSWGDGGGFGGTNEDGRVSLGFARVEGPAAGYRGVNVWGGKDPLHPARFPGKSYGIVCVRGVLYGWVGHGDTAARLWRSTDHAATWEPAAWEFTRADGLLWPTILNFGKDYGGARDGFVYHYFIKRQDNVPPRLIGGDADLKVHTPGVIYLARAPKDRLFDRSAYEWFAGAGAGRPRWSAAAAARRPVFQDPNGVGWCVSVGYNPGLRRYVLATEHGESHRGNLGLFDASEPWGPWTTVTYDTNWLGTGTTFFWNFPAKWLSPDGKDFTLVFTGNKYYDSWNTVRGTFVAGATAAPARPAAAAAFAWETATPESQGMSSVKLEAIKDALAARKTTGFLVVRNDKIVYEWYAPGWSATKPHGTASLAKALVGGMSLAVAVTDGRIALDDPVAKYVPQWKADQRKAKTTIRQLGSHTSGLEDSSVEGVSHTNEPGWKGEFWKRLSPPRDPFTLARDEAAVLFEPGTRLSYSNPGIGMLTYAVTAALRDAPQKDVRTLLRDRVMRPVGAPDAEWSVGYGQTFSVDGLPLVAAWGGGSFTARAAARVGRLVLRRGDWDGTRLLAEGAVRQATTDAGLPGHCGMGWWTNADGRYAKLPRDAVYGAGAGDQILLVVPSLNLIMVRNGDTLAPPPTGANDVFAQFHDERAKVLFEPLIDAVTAPVPPSPVITGVTWAPVESIVRTAKDSDIWATTWADDGNLYTAYGDGTGFVPKVPNKLSQGLARIEGGPEGFRGVNIRSETFERYGDGAKGAKASGMLMVGGVLYALVRNTGNSQLAWSADHGRTWTWADWKFTAGFGCPTFLNFGPNYAGARDDYVYVYSHDGDTAYLPADRVALARVPKDRLRDRSAYEFFKELTPAGPVWTPDVAARGGAFVHAPGKCYRVTVSYDAGLRRYLLCQAGADKRAKAGFGVFDAPEPWGPWTTVTYTPNWDVNPGETCSLPTKWMRADGTTVYLIFSGGDCLAVRKATLTTKEN